MTPAAGWMVASRETCLHPPPQSMWALTLSGGKRVFTDTIKILKWDYHHGLSRWDFYPTTNVFIRGTERRPEEAVMGPWRQRLEERTSRSRCQQPPEAGRGQVQLCRPLDFRLQASRMWVNNIISVVLATNFVVICYGSNRKLICPGPSDIILWLLLFSTIPAQRYILGVCVYKYT